MKCKILAAGLLMSSAASAGETLFLYESGFHPKYATQWFATPTDGNWVEDWELSYSYGDARREVLVRGIGSDGDFFGILLLDCPIPENSEWIATDKYSMPEYVPKEAIIALRLELCPQGERL